MPIKERSPGALVRESIKQSAPPRYLQWVYYELYVITRGFSHTGGNHWRKECHVERRITGQQEVSEVSSGLVSFHDGSRGVLFFM
jgi:hypothetical protein